MTTVITYGTYDLFHIGHLNLLRRASELGDRLIVGVSSDEFNAIKGKKSIFPYEHRAAIVSSLKFVDEVFPEENWDQKRKDITNRHADVFVMGDDWEGKFDEYNDICQVTYLPRTDGISTTQLKNIFSFFRTERVNKVLDGMEDLMVLIKQLGA